MTKNILLKIFLLFLIVLTITYLIYINYNNDVNNQIVTIYPDQSATKIKPKEAGGLIIPNANNIIYENLQSQKKITKHITLQPEPERPLSIIQQKIQTVEVTDPIDAILANIIEHDEIKLKKSKLAKKSQLDQSEEIHSATLLNIVEIEPKQPTVPSTNKVGLNIAKIPEQNNRANSAHLLNKQQQNLYTIQLASVKSESEAYQKGENIKKKYAKILNNALIKVRKVQSKKGQFFYLVIAGNYSSLSQAKAICKKLSNNQQSCIVTNY